jgi:glycine cleavage system H protein
MPEYPEDCLYTKDHEWIRIEDKAGVVGITEYAQHSLGDVVYVELPKVGRSYEIGDVFGTVESVKAVSELYMPMSGEITEINEELTGSPEVVNQDPYGDGWMIKVALTNLDEKDDLLSAQEYAEYVKELSEE